MKVWIVTEPHWDGRTIHAVCDSEALAWKVAARKIDLHQEGLGERAAVVEEFELLTEEAT